MAMNLGDSEMSEAIVSFSDDDGGKGKGKKGKASALPGDWYCPTCGDLQFARNQVCRSCGYNGDPMAMMATMMAAMMGKGGKGAKGKGKFGGGSWGGGSERAVVKQIKDYQKSSEENQQKWWNHADNIIQGPRNPNRWDDAILGEFLKSVDIEPDDKFVGTYDGDRGMVVQVKDFQRASETNKELWWKHCEENHKGFRDPSRHRDADLKVFLEMVGIKPDHTVSPPKQEFPKMPGDWDCPSCGDVNFARNEQCRKCGEAKPAGAGYKPPEAVDWRLVEQIKEFQRSAQVNKEAWWEHCDTKHKGMRDPSRHSNDELKEFMRGHGITPAGEQAMMPGDWNCAQCGDLQFARNLACRKCGADKPEGAGWMPEQSQAAQWGKDSGGKGGKGGFGGKGGKDFGGKGGKDFGGKGGKDFGGKGGKDFGGKGGKDFGAKGGKDFGGKGGKDFGGKSKGKGKGDFGGKGGYGGNGASYGGKGGYDGGKAGYGGMGDSYGGAGGGNFGEQGAWGAAQSAPQGAWGAAQSAPMQVGAQPAFQSPSAVDQQAALLQAWQMQKMQAAAGGDGGMAQGSQRWSPY